MNKKPLGRKSYGSIPHLPGSRMGPAEKTIHPGQAKIATEELRDKRDRIYVTEKLDGSNCCVARIGDTVLPLGRAGYLAQTSPHKQHRLFANWVCINHDRFMDILDDGERVIGEWLAQAHGTVYSLIHEPFVVFDIMRNEERIPFWDLLQRVAFGVKFSTPYLVSMQPTPPKEAMRGLGELGQHGALEPIEGVVYRVERDGKFDFMCKYVRPDKVDGKYLDDEVWNWCPESFGDITEEKG